MRLVWMVLLQTRASSKLVLHRVSLSPSPPSQHNPALHIAQPLRLGHVSTTPSTWATTWLSTVAGGGHESRGPFASSSFRRAFQCRAIPDLAFLKGRIHDEECLVNERRGRNSSIFVNDCVGFGDECWMGSYVIAIVE